jgi:5-methylcytosine-specific restriction endonuclease McrA
MVDATPPPTKRCGSCREVLPHSYFYRDPRTRDGYYNACKQCHNRRSIRWAAARRAERGPSRTAVCRHCGAPFAYARPSGKGSRPPDLCSDDCRRVKRQEAKARYRASNREKLNAASVAWQRANPDRMKVIWARNRQRNRDVRLAHQRAYNARRQTPPAARAEYQRRRRAAKKSTVVGRITPALLAAKFAYWGNRCWMCGSEKVETDHVKPLSKDGLHCLANIRPACHSCNATKSARWPTPIPGGPLWRAAS